MQMQLEHASDASGPPSPAVTAAPPTPRLSRLSLQLSLDAAMRRPLLCRVLRCVSQPHLMSQAALSPSPASMSPPACAALAESHEKFVILAGAQRCCMKCAVQSPATELTCNRINTRVSLSHSTSSACLAPAASLSCSVTFVGEYCACHAADALPNGSVPTAFSARQLQAQTNLFFGLNRFTEFTLRMEANDTFAMLNKLFASFESFLKWFPDIEKVRNCNSLP